MLVYYGKHRRSQLFSNRLLQAIDFIWAANVLRLNDFQNVMHASDGNQTQAAKKPTMSGFSSDLAFSSCPELKRIVAKPLVISQEHRYFRPCEMGWYKNSTGWKPFSGNLSDH